MSMLKRLLTLKVRKQKRHMARDGVYVVYNMLGSKNQVENISMGGLSFHYVYKGMRIDKGSQELSLVNGNRTYLAKVAFTAVSDTEIGEILFRNKRVKRQGVRFGNLSNAQKIRLKKFIARCTV
jgi:hypothetical protein